MELGRHGRHASGWWASPLRGLGLVALAAAVVIGVVAQGWAGWLWTALVAVWAAWAVQHLLGERGEHDDEPLPRWQPVLVVFLLGLAAHDALDAEQSLASRSADGLVAVVLLLLLVLTLADLLRSRRTRLS